MKTTSNVMEFQNQQNKLSNTVETNVSLFYSVCSHGCFNASSTLILAVGSGFNNCIIR